RNVDDRVDGDSIDLAAGPWRLSQLKGGRAEWKIGIEKVRSQAKIAAKITSYASSADSAASLYIRASRSTGPTDADTYVESPIEVVTVPSAAPAGSDGAIFSCAIKQFSSAEMLRFRFH